MFYYGEREYVTLVALRGPTGAMIPEPCKPTWAIGTSSTRFAIPSCRRIGSRISGGRVVLAVLLLHPASIAAPDRISRLRTTLSRVCYSPALEV